MAKLLVVIDETDQTYYLCEEGDEENGTDEWAELSALPLEFNGKLYFAAPDERGDVQLYEAIPVSASAFEAVADEDEDEDAEEESEDEEESEPIAE